MSSIEAPIPLSDIESVLAWVDTFKLSRPTKKINRDFSDAVLLAEILSVNYPKLVEMHNYPPRNSQALKLNNWMTLNRKVLKKLKLNLCCSTMEQLATSTPGVIERVLIMVRDKIRRDEETHKKDDNDQEMSSGGSYYEACGDDEHVLVIPLKTRVNGVLETIQQKVVSHETYVNVKRELKDAKDCIDVLKNKVEHLDSLLKLKEERIEELQSQLERKQSRRKEVEALHNSLCMPFDSAPPTPKVDSIVLGKIPPLKSVESISKIPKLEDLKVKEEPKVTKSEESKDLKVKEEPKVTKSEESKTSKPDEAKVKAETKIPIPKVDSDTITNQLSKPSLTEVQALPPEFGDGIVVETVKTEGFKEVEIVQQKPSDDYLDVEDFKDSEDETMVIRIEDSIHKEIKEISSPMRFPHTCEMSFKTMQFN